MTDDIVTRLRASNFNWDCDEAADEIERVRAELVVAQRNVTFYYYKWKYETEKNAKLSNVLHHLSKLKDVQKYQNVSFEELTAYVQKITSAALREAFDDAAT
jgi:hypothetical protein